MPHKDLPEIPKGTVSKIVTDLESQVSEISHDLESEVHLIGKAQGDLSHPSPIMEFIQVKEENAGVLTLRIPSQRPPTQLKNQGRHISAYSLMVEAVLTRINARPLKEGINLLSTMLREYIAHDATLKAYEKTVADIKKLNTPAMLQREQRIKVEKALRSSVRFFTDSSVADIFTTLPSSTPEQRRAKDCYDTDKQAVLELNEDIIQTIRTSLKRTGELAPYSNIINVAISNALKTLNKMDAVAFKAEHTAAAKDEGPTISTAIAELKKVVLLEQKKQYSLSYAKTIGTYIADLFDYPLIEVIDIAHSTDTEKEIAASLCRNLLRRHIKLIFDAFPNLRPAFNQPTELKKLLEPLLEKTRTEFGWGDLGEEEFFDSNASLFEVITNYLTFTESSCLLPDDRKFGGKKPNFPNPAKQSQQKLAGAREDLKLNTSRQNVADTTKLFKNPVPKKTIYSAKTTQPQIKYFN